MQSQVMKSLAEEMIDNTLVERTTRASATAAERPVDDMACSPLHMTPAKKKRRKNGQLSPCGFQGKCRACNKSTTRLCSECEELRQPNDADPWFCHPKNHDR